MVLSWTADEPYPNVIVFAIHGRLVCGDDLQRLKTQMEARAAETGVVVVLDLSWVDRADSSGIGLLLYLNGVARTAGSKLRVASATRLLDVLRLTHTDRVLTLDADLDVSLRAALSIKILGVP